MGLDSFRVATWRSTHTFRTYKHTRTQPMLVITHCKRIGPVACTATMLLWTLRHRHRHRHSHTSQSTARPHLLGSKHARHGVVHRERHRLAQPSIGTCAPGGGGTFRDGSPAAHQLQLLLHCFRDDSLRVSEGDGLPHEHQPPPPHAHQPPPHEHQPPPHEHQPSPHEHQPPPHEHQPPPHEHQPPTTTTRARETP